MAGKPNKKVVSKESSVKKTPSAEFEEEINALDEPTPTKISRYHKVIEHIFLSKFRKGAVTVEFGREELKSACESLGINVVKNIGDLVYTFRYRQELPESVLTRAPKNKDWVIAGAGTAKYRFELRDDAWIEPKSNLAETKILDATPNLVAKYAQRDEQGLLTKIRYNRLIDLFAGIVCYSLQNHLRTTVNSVGQVETDELYIGVDRRGAHYVIPVQAKGGTDKLGIVQIEQDWAMCQEKFPKAICRPVAAQFINHDLIALFEFEMSSKGMKILREKHFLLVPRDGLSDTELEKYSKRSDD